MSNQRKHDLTGSMVTNENGWKSMSIGNLSTILKDLPHGSRVGPNQSGNMTIVDSFGRYLGYIDFKREELHLMEDF
jgi:hypothetical protein